MLGVIGREVGDRWEEWRDYLHYGDYLVLAAIVGGIVYWLIRRRRSDERPAASAAESEG
jgi:membrane protein DedA with SNARE-associated domain